MKINNRLFDLFHEKAKETFVETVQIGLSYTAVITQDGGIGVSFTYYEGRESCMLNDNDFEGKSADLLLRYIHDENPVLRSLAVALVNALNHTEALKMPEDRRNRILFDTFLHRKKMNVAMVGFFKPLMPYFTEREASLEILDLTHNMGDKDVFYDKLGNWADVLFMTSTTLLNNTSEEILGYAGEKVKAVMLGPSTPLVSDAFNHLPVHMLAGTVPLIKEGVIKAIRNGKGTPAIHKCSRKSYINIKD